MVKIRKVTNVLLTQINCTQYNYIRFIFKLILPPDRHSMIKINWRVSFTNSIVARKSVEKA